MKQGAELLNNESLGGWGQLSAAWRIRVLDPSIFLCLPTPTCRRESHHTRRFGFC